MAAKVMKAGPKALAAAAQSVRSGDVVAVPTDTVYGLACDPCSDSAVEKLFRLKNREKKPVPVLCSSPGVARRLVDLSPAANRLAEGHWPGALTIVAPIKRGNGLSRLLDQGSGTLGVRVPASEFCISLASEVGGAVTGTSANVSGVASSRSAAEVVQSLGSKLTLVVDGGTLSAKESTVVKVTDGAVEVLREGSVRIQAGELKA